MAKILKAASVSEVLPGAPKVVTVDGTDLALFQVDGRFYALDNACPHRGGPLSEGPVKGTTVTCPWHAWDFDVTTGECLNNPAAKVRCHPVQIQDNDLLVTL